MTWRKIYESTILTSWVHETPDRIGLPLKLKSEITITSLFLPGDSKKTHTVEIKGKDGYLKSETHRFDTKKDALAYITKFKKAHP